MKKKINYFFPKKTIPFLSVVIFFLVFSQAEAFEYDNEIILKVGDYKQNVDYNVYSQWLSFSPSLASNKNYQSEIENINFCPYNSIFCQLTVIERLKLHIQKSDSTTFDQEKAKIFLEDFSKKVDKEPVNAKFKIENEKVSIFVPDEKGSRLNLEQGLTIISEALKNNESEINLPFDKIDPKIKSKDINNLGINTLIGEGTSNFKGSPSSRIHNIKVATERFNGFLLAPEEEFSFVEILGPVDGENGYLPELVIKQDRTEPEFGGGICQVSTTAFRAAIYSGLKITARKNHAYPVSYYNPQGMDATIYIPKPDLRFVNNTSNYILIQTKIEGTQLTFSFFGTSDNRSVEVKGPFVMKKNSDGSMSTTFSQKVTDKNGTTIINDTFNSYYDSPSKYPHPGDTPKLTKKPDDWSTKQWKEYKKANGL
ncbi:MAG: VanW family protein [uncultured bacterium]|nr:MAG: VanW family protein [uncultured bacterium]HBR71177.1 hypothetical protein [Candidatus Moranbacteria bacterium]